MMHTTENSGLSDGMATRRPPRWLRSAAMWSTARLAAGMQSIRGNRCRDGFGILMYHRVAHRAPGVSAPTWNVTPERLERQLTGLLARGFEPWPLRKLIQARRESRPIPPNAFAVTFDDGHVNNYSQAWSVLRALQVPATIFLATKYLDTDGPFPFDDWSAAGSSQVPADCWKPLSTTQCGELLAGGLIELGAHTHSHDRFVGRANDFRQDMRACLDLLRDRFEIDHPTFAFPFGANDAEMIEIAKHIGVACCLSTEYRRVGPGDDEFHWGRFNVEASDTAATLAAKLSGWYTSVVSARNTLTRPLANVVRPTRHQRSNGCADAARSDGPGSRRMVSQA
jgi:peptidoglycan/xylan/chitin deacetylase (PgdA/CDA1 family)